MTAPVSSTASNPRSRRALLAGALGGLGAWAASAVGRAGPVRAEGENIVVGGEYVTASSRTFLRNVLNNNRVFEASSEGAGIAVLGSSTGSVGIYGTSDASSGVYGSGNSAGATGVHGFSFSGTALRGTSSTGFALRTSGRLDLGTSGVATIAAGSTGKTVNPGVNVTSGTFVLLTPRTNIGGRSLWFTTNASANTFRIRMSSARSSNTKVAWLLLG
jgi:hypothetical protein